MSESSDQVLTEFAKANVNRRLLGDIDAGANLGDMLKALGIPSTSADESARRRVNSAAAARRLKQENMQLSDQLAAARREREMLSEKVRELEDQLALATEQNRQYSQYSESAIEIADLLLTLDEYFPSAFSGTRQVLEAKIVSIVDEQVSDAKRVIGQLFSGFNVESPITVSGEFAGGKFVSQVLLNNEPWSPGAAERMD